MGFNARALAVVGLKISPEVLVEEKRMKAFEHDYPEEWEVDPRTGRKLWKKGYALKPPFTAESFVRDFELKPEYIDDYKLGAYKVFVSCDVPYPGWDWSAFVALWYASTAGLDNTLAVQKVLHVPAIAIDLQTFMDELGKHDLWRDKNFGLWAIQRVSV